MILVVSCSSAGPPAPKETCANWLEPHRVARVGRSVLASPGRGPAGRRARIIWRRSSGALHGGRVQRARPSLHPISPYAKVADLVSLAAQGDEVVALGTAHGGAHANFRWTVWAGSTQRLDEYPQTFETFGGQSAGGLLDIVITSEGPAIAGTWAARAGGLDAAVWLPRAASGFVRNPLAPRSPTHEIQVAPRAANGAGSTMIISGSVITFGDGAEQRAAVWIWPNRSSAWTLQQLPDAGTHSEALSSACAQTCWVSGHADGKWRCGASTLLSPLEPRAATRPCPPWRSTPTVRGRERSCRATGPVVFSHAGSTRLVVSDGHNGWQTFTAPSGSVLDATWSATVFTRSSVATTGSGFGPQTSQQSTEVLRTEPVICGRIQCASSGRIENCEGA